jgi:hypothetical protein
MKSRLFIFMVITLVALLSVCTRAATDTGEIEAKIKLAVDYLLAPGGPGEDAKAGFKLLIEVIEMAAPETEFPAEFRKKISKAKKLFDSTSIFNQEAISLIKDSYLLAHSGKKFQMPDNISSIKQAKEYAQKRIEEARKYLKQGKSGVCAKILLEIALMIVTPVT